MQYEGIGKMGRFGPRVVLLSFHIYSSLVIGPPKTHVRCKARCKQARRVAIIMLNLAFLVGSDMVTCLDPKYEKKKKNKRMVE